ncbi:Putative adhesin [Streptosporangium subroseum]|uniref:Putative adhesin n=1 Tax=Streptosporangium subroseum TaxID=106412 RepID=A0A239BBM1_9ACTN|nr:DUF4097 family beta strand repeat-containing protein [Streptosporangium subroseum]SNS05357.1 Putative adhesin [Streptosporangium subroseum]
MPVFQTPGPVALQVRFPAGDLRITATPREDTVVEVRPANPSRSADVQGAEQIRVEHLDGTIFVTAPEQHLSQSSGSNLEILIGLPEGSRVDFTTASADVRMTGRLGEVTAKSASGDTWIDCCTGLSANAASGDVTCDVTEGDAWVKTASGDVGLRDVHGEATVTTASGRSELGTVGGAVAIQTASGRSRIRAAGDSVQAKSASADVTVESVIRGSVAINTISGNVEIGVVPGTNAWLDVSSMSGGVGSSLDQADQPTDGGEQVEIHARTLSGDISIIRARS